MGHSQVWYTYKKERYWLDLYMWLRYRVSFDFVGELERGTTPAAAVRGTLQLALEQT